MFSDVLAQFQNSYLLEELPVLNSASFIFGNRRSSDVIQPISSKPQSQLFSQEFVPAVVG